MRRSRGLAAAAAMAVTVTFSVVTLLPAGGAAAEDGGGAEVVDQVDASRSEVAAEVASDEGKASTEAVEQEFLEDQAREGVLWDASEVAAATIGDDTEVAYSENVNLASVETAVVEQADGELTSEIQIEADMADAGQQAGSTGFRVGADSLRNVSGQVAGSYDGGAVTVDVEGDKVTSYWERYQVKEPKDDRKIFYYGHWATAVGKTVGGGGFDHNPGLIDIRSRPKVGRKGDFINWRNSWPKESQSDCDTTSVSVGILGFSAGLPLGNCEGFVPEPNATAYQMKNVWSDGACRDGRSEYVDLGMAVDVKAAVSTAVLSDYAYARFESAPCNQSESNDVRVIYADPGWS